MPWLEPFIAEQLGPVGMTVSHTFNMRILKSLAYLNDIPYCDTDSNPDFQTRVTSQALVACSRHERNAETALPPTMQNLLAFCTIVRLTPHKLTKVHFPKQCAANDKKGELREISVKYVPDNMRNLGGEGAILA